MLIGYPQICSPQTIIDQGDRDRESAERDGAHLIMVWKWNDRCTYAQDHGRVDLAVCEGGGVGFLIAM